MDGRNEQRVAIKFCFKACLSVTETLVLVQKAYGNEALNQSNVFRLYSWFQDRRELVEDDEGVAVQNRLKLRWTLLLLLIWSKITVESHQEWWQNLWTSPRLSSSDSKRGSGKEKAVCMFFSTLRDAWAKGRSCHILPRHYRNGRCRQKFFNKIIIGNENWCFAYDPGTNQQNCEWLSETSPWPKKLKFQRSRIKTMLIIFFDSQGTVHKEFVSEGKTVNAEFYKGVMDHLLKHIQRVRPDAFCSRDFFLLHNNASTHKAASVRQFLTPKNVTTLYHPPL